MLLTIFLVLPHFNLLPLSVKTDVKVTTSSVSVEMKNLPLDVAMPFVTGVFFSVIGCILLEKVKRAYNMARALIILGMLLMLYSDYLSISKYG